MALSQQSVFLIDTEEVESSIYISRSFLHCSKLIMFNILTWSKTWIIMVENRHMYTSSMCLHSPPLLTGMYTVLWMTNSGCGYAFIGRAYSIQSVTWGVLAFTCRASILTGKWNHAPRCWQPQLFIQPHFSQLWWVATRVQAQAIS